MHRPIQLTKTTSSRATSQVTRPNENKAIGGTRFHALIAGLRPASLILARRIAFPLLLLGAGLVLVPPCAAAPLAFENTGSLITARYFHTATLLPNGNVLVAGGFNGDDYRGLASAELYDPASGSGRRLAASPPHALFTRRRCCLTARCSSQAVLARAPASFLRARNSTIRQPEPGPQPAASRPHVKPTRRHCCPTAGCSLQGGMAMAAQARARNSTIR